MESYNIGLTKVESEVRAFIENELKNLEEKFEDAKK